MIPIYSFKNHKRVVPLCGFEARRYTDAPEGFPVRSPCSVCVSAASPWMACSEDLTSLYFDPPYTAQRYYTTINLGEWDWYKTSLYAEFYRLKVPKTINGVLNQVTPCRWHFIASYQCGYYSYWSLHPPGWEENGLNTEAWEYCGSLNPCGRGYAISKRTRCEVSTGFTYTDKGIGASLGVKIDDLECLGNPLVDPFGTELRASYVPYFPPGSEKFNPHDPLVFVFNELTFQKGGLFPSILPPALTFYPAV